jgi:succinate-semialdehyde dehydrogenase/glutarate-semialdehyde dehydrogenase
MSGTTIDSINPATEERIKSYVETTPEETKRTLEQTGRAFERWRETPIQERAVRMKKAAALLQERKEEYARLMTLEMGKPILQARAEIEKCAWACEYYSEHGAEMLRDEVVATDASRSFVTFQPLGVVLAIMPWNFPFWQVFRFAAPSLMAGNGALLKHAPGVFGCALAIEELFRAAGFPEHLLRVLLIHEDRVAGVMEHPLVAAVTLTGGTAAGKAVASKAGSLIKKSVLELGGSDPYLILEDADLEQAVEACAASRLMNCGQSCIAAKRFVVVEPLRRQFEQLLVQKMKSSKIGDPMDETVDLGPMARLDLRNDLHKQVKRSIEKGARLLLGGTIPESKGAWYTPTILSEVAKGMPACDEELFGPVAAVLPAADDETAIRIANDTTYGLGAAVFTRDLDRGERIAATRLRAGACFVNTYVRSDPRLPFGGIKESGYGRELSAFGIREFVNIKTVYIR